MKLMTADELKEFGREIGRLSLAQRVILLSGIIEEHDATDLQMEQGALHGYANWHLVKAADVLALLSRRTRSIEQQPQMEG